jgi:hypothetical protein
METPFFPAFRARLAALGQADEGPNSRDRVFSLRRTFFGFLYQGLSRGKNPAGCPNPGGRKFPPNSRSG